MPEDRVSQVRKSSLRKCRGISDGIFEHDGTYDYHTINELVELPEADSENFVMSMPKEQLLDAAWPFPMETGWSLWRHSPLVAARRPATV